MSHATDEALAAKLKERAICTLAQFVTFSTTSKYEYSIQDFDASARIYEKTFRWFEAAECYKYSASVLNKLGRSTQSAATYYRAAINYERSKEAEREAITCYQEAIELYCSDGRFINAAMRAERVAELFVRLDEIDNAKSYYYQAKEYYDSGEDFVACMRCLEMYARMLATQKDYERAKQQFDDLNHRLLQHDLLKFHAKRIVIYSVICCLLGNDLAEAKRLNKQARSNDCTFPLSKEDEFTRELFESVKNDHLDDYIDLVYSFDYMRELDDWELDMFGRQTKILQENLKKKKEEEERKLEAEKEKLIEQKELVQRKRRERLRKLGARGVQ